MRSTALAIQEKQWEIVGRDDLRPDVRVNAIIKLEKARWAYIRASQKARDVIFEIDRELKED